MDLPTDNIFGTRLRWIRKRAALSLNKFGDLLGFDQSYLSRLERGKATNPSAEFIRRVCTLCKINYEWLEHGIGQPDSQTVSPSHVFSDSGQLKPSSKPYSPVGEELEESIQFHAAISLFMEEMSWQQILRCLQKVIRNTAISEKGKVFWVRILGDWANVKMELEEKKSSSATTLSSESEAKLAG